MKNKFLLFGVIVIVVIGAGFSIWTYVRHLDYLSKTTHETDRWAVILDSQGDIIAVEPTDDEIWNSLESLNQNQSEMWIGGIVEEFNNEWGFRFKPDTIVVAQITIEGAQSNIQGISEDLDYWMNVWAKETYVLARVLEIHE